MNFETDASSKCKTIYKLDWLALIFGDVTSSCLSFADKFWNWRVIYLNIVPYLANFIIKLIPKIYCFRNFLELNFHFPAIHFQWCSSPHFGTAISRFWFRFHPSMFLLRELYEQEHCHHENNNYHLGVPGSDWPHTTASRADMEKVMY